MQIDWDQLLTNKFVENIDITGKNVFCDVGACDGIFTQLFKNLSGENGMVYSFELNTFNYNRLKCIASDRCICENIAISDSNGFVDFYANHTGPGNGLCNIVGHDIGSKVNFIGKIESVSLDEYFKNKTVDYMKIDVEGAELKVFKGGLNTISKCKYVIVECHFEKDWEEFYDLLVRNNLNFRNLVTDEPVYFKHNTEVIPGGSSVGRPYQMYRKI